MLYSLLQPAYGGVDLLDALLALYQIPVRSKKWYHRLLFHYLDMLLVQSWLMSSTTSTCFFCSPGWCTGGMLMQAACLARSRCLCCDSRCALHTAKGKVTTLRGPSRHNKMRLDERGSVCAVSGACDRQTQSIVVTYNAILGITRQR